MSRLFHASDSSAYKNNVMVPLNWFTGIADVALMSGLITSDVGWVKIFCAGLIAVIIVFYASVYVYFMCKAPDRLQSEGYNIRKQEIATLLGRSKGEIEVHAVTSETENEGLLGSAAPSHKLPSQK